MSISENKDQFTAQTCKYTLPSCSKKMSAMF